MNVKDLKKLVVVMLLFLAIVYVYYYKNDKNYFNSFDKSYNLNLTKIKSFYESIKEEKIYSQNKEDGVTLSLINFLGIKNGTFVEFGVQDGSETNTRILRENYNWKGLMMDSSIDNLSINKRQEIISYSNILNLFKKYKVDLNLDLFSEDTDYADYWIVEKVLTKYRPKIVIHEVNQQPPNLCVTVEKPKPNKIIYWDGTNYHGGSVCAFYCLAKKNDYTMVYCESKGVNCFWIRYIFYWYYFLFHNIIFYLNNKK
jgi:hypothetical protein